MVSFFIFQSRAVIVHLLFNPRYVEHSIWRQTWRLLNHLQLLLNQTLCSSVHTYQGLLCDCEFSRVTFMHSFIKGIIMKQILYWATWHGGYEKWTVFFSRFYSNKFIANTIWNSLQTVHLFFVCTWDSRSQCTAVISGENSTSVFVSLWWIW